MYNDDGLSTPENFEKMAREYAEKLKDEGFKFFPSKVHIDFLLDEVFEILFKLRSSYRFLRGFLGSENFLELTETQIDKLRKIFSYNKNRGFRVRVNSTKCLLNSISLESELILKINLLAQNCDYLDELSNLINARLLL